VISSRAVNDFVNRAQCDPGTNVKLPCENSVNGTNQLFPRTRFHPVAGRARAERAFCINLFRLSGYGENPRPAETRCELFEKENSVVMAKERFNDQQIWLMLFRQFTRGPFISGKSADCIAQVTADNRSKTFSGDRTVVSDKYRRLSRGERSGECPHKLLSLIKSRSDDKQNSLAASYSSVTATLQKSAANSRAEFSEPAHR
jgi:hypothetical protein